MPKIIENKLKQEFKNRKSFSRAELFQFFKNFEPDLKEGTFSWRVYDLKNKNIIKPIKRGLYTISHKSKYKPGYSAELLKLTRKLTNQFEDVMTCVWSTKLLNEFSRHQSSKNMIIFEVEKDILESAFYELKDIYAGDVFLTPDEKTINLYVAESTQPVVIKKLITRSPMNQLTEKKLNFLTPSLEKILVDLFVEDKLFYYLQGQELVHIFENAINGYSINFTKLFSYANRRNKGNELNLFLRNNVSHLVKDII